MSLVKKHKTKTDRIKEQAKKRLLEKKPDVFESDEKKKKEKNDSFNFLLNGLMGISGLALLFLAGPMSNNIFMLVAGSVLIMIPTMNYSNFIARKRVEKKKQEKLIEKA